MQTNWDTFVQPSFFLFVFSSFCRFCLLVLLPFCLFVFLSSCLFAFLSFQVCDAWAMRTNWDTLVLLSLYLFVISSFCLIVFLPFCLIVFLSVWGSSDADQLGHFGREPWVRIQSMQSRSCLNNLQASIQHSKFDSDKNKEKTNTYEERERKTKTMINTNTKVLRSSRWESRSWWEQLRQPKFTPQM